VNRRAEAKRAPRPGIALAPGRRPPEDAAGSTGEPTGASMAGERRAEASGSEATVARQAGAAGDGALARPAAMAILLALIAAFMVADLVDDVAAQSRRWHVATEVVVTLLALVGLGIVWRTLASSRRRARDLQVALDGTSADLARWRGEAQEALRGLGAAIDRQFERWSLSPAEREVALLLLKGLPLREVAQSRWTSERTVRQQALAVYRKAGMAGRAELAAFFLQDLLLPRGGEAPEADPGLASGPGRG
jgi:DNA-binding CsgD family transcriptional regulator